MRLEPDSSDVAINLGELCWRQGKLAEAERHYRGACETAKGYARGTSELVRFLWAAKSQHELREGNVSEAERIYREALVLAPKFAPVYSDLGYMLIADSNRWSEAEELIRKSVELASDKERPICLDSLGELLAKQPRRRAEAINAYRAALTAFSENGTTNQVVRVRKILDRLEQQ